MQINLGHRVNIQGEDAGGGRGDLQKCYYPIQRRRINYKIIRFPHTPWMLIRWPRLKFARFAHRVWFAPYIFPISSRRLQVWVSFGWSLKEIPVHKSYLIAHQNQRASKFNLTDSNMCTHVISTGKIEQELQLWVRAWQSSCKIKMKYSQHVKSSITGHPLIFGWDWQWDLTVIFTWLSTQVC